MLNLTNFSITGFAVHSNNSTINQNDGVLIYMNTRFNYDIQHFKLKQSNVRISSIKFIIDKQ